MSRPIEEGCLAIVVNGARPGSNKSSVGMILRVGKFIGKVVGCVGEDRWEVDKPVYFTDGTQDYHQRACNMQRIDEDGADTDTDTVTATTDTPAEVGV